MEGGTVFRGRGGVSFLESGGLGLSVEEVQPTLLYFDLDTKQRRKRIRVDRDILRVKDDRKNAFMLTFCSV